LGSERRAIVKKRVGDFVRVPRNNNIARLLVEWCKANRYSQGDDYYVVISATGQWGVGYSNDYPLQHGEGRLFMLSDQEVVDVVASAKE